MGVTAFDSRVPAARAPASAGEEVGGRSRSTAEADQEEDAGSCQKTFRTILSVLKY